MSALFHFSLVAPERELFSGDVEHVIAPGEEGEFGVLAGHSPFMAVLKPGALRIIAPSGERRIFVRGGFADVTPDGLTVLADSAVDIADVDAAKVAADIRDAEDDVKDARDDAHRRSAEARLADLKTLQAAIAA
jgi:F-type H+-transporting ATPase subunit epsilon